MLIDQERIDALKEKQQLTFSEALEMLKFDLKVKRYSWPIQFMRIKRPTAVNDGSRRDACFVNELGHEMSLLSADVLSDDWFIVE